MSSFANLKMDPEDRKQRRNERQRRYRYRRKVGLYLVNGIELTIKDAEALDALGLFDGDLKEAVERLIANARVVSAWLEAVEKMKASVVPLRSTMTA